MTTYDRRATGSSRRDFLKTAAAAGTLYWLGPKLMMDGRVLAAVPGGTLAPGSISKYTQPLVIPPVMPPTNENLVVPGGKNVAYYEIEMRQFTQQIVPGLTTTVWSYGSANHAGTFNYPAFTLETTFKKPLRVKWINGLVDGAGNYLPHLLPVDPTLHWTNPPTPPDSKPTFAATPGRYTGPVPIVTHVHGASGVGDESDGYAEAWFLPDAANIPAGYARVGTWYNFFASKAARKFGVVWEPGSAVYQYPNEQRASTLWYHDHALGMTRVNVYAGPAGFWLVRGGPGDGNVKGYRAPRLGDGAGVVYTEIPLAIQDRSFNNDGSLFYPDSRAFFDDGAYHGPYIPETLIPPIWVPEFFGNVMVVNGKAWPQLDVQPRRYRFRVLNGCNSRFLRLKLSNGMPIGVIGNEGGLLPAPLLVEDLLVAPAERYDIVLDFTGLAVGTTVTLQNTAPDGPFTGDPGQPPADPATTGQVTRFNVVPPTQSDASRPVDQLNLPPIRSLSGGSARRVALLEEMMDDVVSAVVLGIVSSNGLTASMRMWDDPITENPAVGATEVWEIYNFTADAHPIHIHETVFQVVNRQAITFAETGLMDPMIDSIAVAGPLLPPQPPEFGFKDTVIAYPGQVTRVRLRFNNPGQFVWHCHIVEHEDNEMMRPYSIGPLQNPA